tara:strand:- start:2501 stop:3127 length:627 start_codon:yes stop_codon:yes gene_type:complete
VVDLFRSKINFIVFDIGGVLLDIYPDRMVQYISDVTEISPKIIRDCFPEDIHEEYERGQISDYEWFVSYKKALLQPNCLKEADFWEAWNRLLGQETNVVDIMMKLKNTYSVWLLSNTNQRHVRNEIEKKYVFSQLADGTIYSFEEGARKPEKEIFNIAAEKIGADLNTCLFIDDKKENVTSAKSAGFLGLHYIDTQRLERDLGYLGVI